MLKNFFASTKGAILAGLVIGLGAATLQKLGNPGNMGLCVGCFGRDVVGALGLHRAEMVQYARPEIFGLVLGAFLAAVIHGEFRPQMGSSPLIRFFLGIFVGVGALIFLGCPWRAMLRLAGGDWNALVGLGGLVVGATVGALFFRQSFSLGATQKSTKGYGLVFVLFMAALLSLRLAYPPIPGQPKNDLLFYSVQGPGSQYAPLWAALGFALIIGYVGQRSRFCSVGAIQSLVLFRRFHLSISVVVFVLSALVANLFFGQFHPGFANQPIAHTNHLWNFLSLVIVGFGSTLAGGCPGRQLFMAGEGNADAGLFVLGMFGGLAMAHNFGLASSGAGLGPHGATAGIISLAMILLIAFLGLRKIESAGT
ncbi:MAG: YedE-related selenium metabolism membrane protein [Deltaproteobacteria bacterium]|jgi:YedE family putative selenium metabolism protein|nr:YedE-related selenium metabolism membrane protein [Deltaproteobacteria bacterium]